MNQRGREIVHGCRGVRVEHGSLLKLVDGTRVLRLRGVHHAQQFMHFEAGGRGGFQCLKACGGVRILPSLVGRVRCAKSLGKWVGCAVLRARLSRYRNSREQKKEQRMGAQASHLDPTPSPHFGMGASARTSLTLSRFLGQKRASFADVRCHDI